MVELTPWPDCRIHARNSTGRGGGCVNKDTAFPPSSNPLSLLQTNHTQNLRKGKFVYGVVVVVVFAAAAAAASNRQTDRQTDRRTDRQTDGQTDRRTDGQTDRQTQVHNTYEEK